MGHTYPRSSFGSDFFAEELSAPSAMRLDLHNPIAGADYFFEVLHGMRVGYFQMT